MVNGLDDFEINSLNVLFSNSEANESAKPNNKTCYNTVNKTPGSIKYK